MTTNAPSSAVKHRIGADGLLVVRLEDGDVEIVGVDGEAVAIRAERPDAVADLVIERGERSLAVSAGRGSSPDDLSIEVPSAATVVVESRSGDITVARLTGDARVTTGSGDVIVRDGGGSLAVEAVSGDVEIGASGELEVAARTVSGDLGIRAGVLRRAHLTTTSGDLTIIAAFADAGAFRIETVSGDTSIEAHDPIRVEATTLTGDIGGPSVAGRDERPRGTVVVGSATGPTVGFRSTSGDLSLRIIETPAPDIAPAIWPAPATTAVDPSLDVLRALERGEIDVAEATERLDALESQVDPRV